MTTRNIISALAETLPPVMRWAGAVAQRLRHFNIAVEGKHSARTPDVKRQVEIQCKYDGYLQRQEAEVRKFKHLEGIEIPETFDYSQVPGLSNEARQRLTEIQPLSLGQASRISGITPAAISILMVFLKRYKEEARVREGS